MMPRWGLNSSVVPLYPQQPGRRGCGGGPPAMDHPPRRGGLGADPDRPLGSRIWLYTNFDCNLCCDYCCVRSSPRAARRPLGVDTIRRIAAEAAELGVGEIFITGGEPFLLPDIGDIIAACAAAAPTTVLTNGMLLKGRRLEMLRRQSQSRVTLQVSIDSATADGTIAIAAWAVGHAHGRASPLPGPSVFASASRRRCRTRPRRRIPPVS